MPNASKVSLPYHWLGKEAESAEVVAAYYPPVPLIVIDDTEEVE